MVAGRYDNNYTYKNYVADWEDLANILNAVPIGASKNWNSWRKTWQDKKSRAKKKLSLAKKSANKTGGGPNCIPTITETEEKWIEILKPVAIEGDTTVQESSVDDIIFDVEDICGENALELIYEKSDEENITPKILHKSQESVAHTSKNKLMTSQTPHKLQDKIPKKMSKAGEIASAVNHFKTITVEDTDVRKANYKEKLKKLDKIIGLKERKCKTIERLAEAVERLSQ